MIEYAKPSRTTWGGDPAFLYSAGELDVVVLPRRGGKFASIRHRDREWLTQPRRPLLPLSDLPPLLVDGDMFGWDECAPTIDDCDFMGRRLPLHGDAWDQPWVDSADRLGVRGRYIDYTLLRRLSVRPDGFRLDYAATAPVRTPFLWAAHPQFVATPATQVVLGDGTDRPIDMFDRGYWRGHLAGDPIRLGDLPHGMSAKLFAPPDRPTAEAWLLHSDGAALTMRWDASVAPYLGVWLDRAGIGPTNTIAIEPMTGYADSLAAAATANRVLRLDPSHPITWWLDLSFAAALPSPPPPHDLA